jgi:hypothetical protein
VFGKGYTDENSQCACAGWRVGGELESTVGGELESTVGGELEGLVSDESEWWVREVEW